MIETDNLDIRTYDELDTVLHAIDFAEEAEAETDEVSEPSHWLPDTPDKANWLLQKLAEVQREDADTDEIAEREIERIQMWQSREKQKRGRRRAWLENCLNWFTREQYKVTGKQTVSLPFGKASLKAPAWKLRLDAGGEIADGDPPKEVIAWLKENRPDLIKVVESPNIAGIKKIVAKPSAGDGIQPAVIAETGEEVPGLVVEIAADLVFSYSVDGGGKNDES